MYVNRICVILSTGVSMTEEYKVGDIITGQVTGIEKYGIFVNIDPWYNGLIHISEISEEFVKNILDYVAIGETIYCQVLEVNEENLQLKLSIKNINYKANGNEGPIKETRKGFLPLKDNLNVWLSDTVKE